MNTLLILLSPTLNRDVLIKHLEQQNIINFWFYSFPNSLFIKTNLNSEQISRLIEKDLGQHIHFITQIEDDFFGRMDQDYWTYFKRARY